MPRPATNLATEFMSHLRYLEQTRTKTEELLTNNVLVRRDVEQVYSGLYLEAVSSFERFIEDLFLGLLMRRLIPTSRSIHPLINVNSDLVARNIVFGGRKYVDWIPYEQYTELRAKAFFREGLPFTSLQSPDKQLIERLYYVRNAIAHKSNHSKRMFREKVVGTIPVTPREKTPVGFLRSIYRTAPIQTRYQDLLIQMASIAQKLCR